MEAENPFYPSVELQTKLIETFQHHLANIVGAAIGISEKELVSALKKISQALPEDLDEEDKEIFDVLLDAISSSVGVQA